MIFFNKIALELLLRKKKPIIRTLGKKLGKHLKQNYNAAFSQLQKKVNPHRLKISVFINKERK